MVAYTTITFLLLALGLPLLLTINRAIKIIPHYLQARKLNLPIYISLFTWQDNIWQLLWPYFLWLRHLPFGLGRGIEFSYFGWTDVDKGRTHAQIGNAFCMVSPNRLEIFCAEPTVCAEVMQKWKVWTKSQELYAIFNTFGKNLNSSNHGDWQRHRKITSQAFRESTYELVWEESLKQANQLLHSIGRDGQSNLGVLRSDFALLAMHVLSSAVLGHSYDYGAGLQQVEAGHKLSYFASLSFILNNLMAVIILGGLKAPDWLLPSFLRNLRLSVKEFQQHLTEAAEQGIKAGPGARTGASLVTALLQANEEEKFIEGKAGGLPTHLTDEEVFGNLYMFNLAGYETTSFSLSFTIPWLALNPDLQDWIQEEIDAVFGADQQLDYEHAFDKLPRCRALMYETLRTHAAAAAMPRLSPPDQVTELYFPSLDRTIEVPPDTYVTTNFPALHNNPKTWGEDVYTYNPRRFITKLDDNTNHTFNDTRAATQTKSSPATNPFAESLLPEPHPSKSQPISALFMPWLTGPRVCPGKKFSQVEFVAVIAGVFRNWTVEPAKLGGNLKGDDSAVVKLREAIGKAQFDLTPKLWKPEEAAVRWVQREKR